MVSVFETWLSLQSCVALNTLLNFSSLGFLNYNELIMDNGVFGVNIKWDNILKYLE